MKRILYLLALVFYSVAAQAQDPELLKKAQAGDADAQYKIARFYLPNGKAVSEEGMKWLTKAAENGHAFAQWVLQYTYLFGRYGQTKNDEKYVYWLTKLAKNNDIEHNKFEIGDAQYHLGMLYESGECGFERNISEFLKWEKKAAFNDYVPAAYSLGLHYKREGDKQEAIYWLKKVMDIQWQKLHEEDECCYKELRELGVTYHPADHVGHNHSGAASASNPPSSASQNQGSQVREYTETVPVQVWQACGACNGSGQCGVCYGQGWTYSNGSYNGRRTCIACHGTGKCTSCAGQGGQNVVRYEQRTVYR